MALNRESNAYTIIFAVIMVVIVGGGLAAMAKWAKPYIVANEQNEKKQNIIQAMADSTLKADITREQAKEQFPTLVKRRVTLSYNGDILFDSKEAGNDIDPKNPDDAFNVNLRKQYKLYGKKIIKENRGDDAGLRSALAKEENIKYPMFIGEKEGETVYVVPAVGTGLWDDVWGYIGINSDFTEIIGSTFDHKGETPGLGSKITEDWFEDQFKGKKLVNEDGSFATLQLLKPGVPTNEYQVNGISGATFTGVGVADMLERTFVVYQNFFKNNPNF